MAIQTLERQYAQRETGFFTSLNIQSLRECLEARPVAGVAMLEMKYRYPTASEKTPVNLKRQTWVEVCRQVASDETVVAP
ncbi:MAG: hypothetical protein KDK08_27110 [Rhizobiaceae bacterium]|nr:hypothetical protein [Rhizobiaceae bacterium]